MNIDTNRLLITNCRLLDFIAEGETTSILIENGVISQIGPVHGAEISGTYLLNAQGAIAVPGFIDVHIQGAGGADVLDGTEDAFRTISRTSAKFGTTGFLATTIFRPGEENEHLKIAAQYVGKDLGGANLLGIHLEGPFISPNKRGMIRPDCVAEPSLRLLNEIQKVTKGRLKIMTIAPELQGNLKIIRSLVAAGIIASFGHSNATYEETIEGFKAGISHVTHLFNAMPPLHHRLPGPLAAIFETKHITAQLITDGVHIHPAVLRLACAVLGPGRIIPITDGMQAMGLQDGKYIYNGVEYESKNGTARYKDGTLIGTAMGMNQIVGRLAKYSAYSLSTAVATASENPAGLLGLMERKGNLTAGKDADIVILDEDFSVRATIVGGKVVFSKYISNSIQEDRQDG
jgi:N-acetylglucosamine-6-phosphate deacetylase